MREALDNVEKADDVMEQTSSLFLSDDYKEVTAVSRYFHLLPRLPACALVVPTRVTRAQESVC